MATHGDYSEGMVAQSVLITNFQNKTNMWIPTKPSPSQWKKGTYLLLALFALLLCGHFLCGNNEAVAQNKKVVTDTIPKRYAFILDSVGYSTVDSILRLSLQTTGYELKAKDADGLRNGLSMVITYFQREKQRQDTTVYQKPKNK